MKCMLVVVSCLLGAAFAGYAAPGFPYAYNGYPSYPAASYNHAGGIPQPVQDTYEVAAAKAEHLRAHAAARAQAGSAAPDYYGSHSVAGPPQPVQDTHEVAAAKAEHFRAHAAAAHGYAHAAAPAHYGYPPVAPLAHGYPHAAPFAHGYPHYGAEAAIVDPVAIAAGAPLPVADTYEVAAAKAAHLKAHAAAKSGHLGLY